MMTMLRRLIRAAITCCVTAGVLGGGAWAHEPAEGGGVPFRDIDPADCYAATNCDAAGRCPALPAYCSDSSDPEFSFVPTFADAPDPGRVTSLDPAFIAPRGDTLDFWPEDRTAPFQVRIVEAPVPGKTLIEGRGGMYLEFTVGRMRIRVINEYSPRFPKTALPADVTLKVAGVALDEVELEKTFGTSGVPGGELSLDSVKVFRSGQAGAPAASPLAEEALGITSPGFDTCEVQAVHQFAQGTYNGTLAIGMPPVRFPPVIDSGYSDCSKDQCIAMYLGWIRSHHNVWRARQMLQLLSSIPNADQREYAWARPGRDWQGQLVTERSSPQHWFGVYSSDALQQTRVALDKLWNRYTSNKVGDFSVKLRCPTSGGNVCATTADVAAHHIVVSQVDFCDPYFNSDGICLIGWDAEEEVCNGVGVSAEWEQAMIVAHEMLHHTTINGAFVQDKHSHGHGDLCLSGLKILQAMYGYANIRHLATHNGCIHDWLARHNNDSYAYFLTTIGDMVYRGQMKTWPAWGDPTPQPPQNCTAGDEGCYCLDVNPMFDAPDGDDRADQWCPDHDGEMTCQKTTFNAGATVGICTKCDSFRGAGCECDDDRPCDKGSCWGSVTANGHQTVGHCYDAQPPSWTCLADCKALYNSPSARCYHDHPSGTARCIDGVICEEPEEYDCYQQGKVCFDGQCITECVGTENCRYDGQPGELDLDYPSYFVCTDELRCEALPQMGN